MYSTTTEVSINTNNKTIYCCLFLIILYFIPLAYCFSLTVKSEALNNNSQNNLINNNNKKHNTRIVGGTIAGPHEFPHMVSIQDNLTLTHRCGGSLIDNRYILTAAQCLVFDNTDTPRAASYFSLVLGYSDYSQCPRTYNVFNQFGCVRLRARRVIIHEAFNPTTLLNDIGLIELETPVPFTPNIRPIALLSDLLPDGFVVTATGWGDNPKRVLPLNQRDDNSLYAQSILAKVHLPIVPERECNRQGYANYLISRETRQICAGRNFASTCASDTGGPLSIPILNTNNAYIYAVLGITSFGNPCTLNQSGASMRSVYTSVPQFVDWILSRASGMQLYNGIESLGMVSDQ
ncbi:hypothetical protein ABK040_002465 [Willaertia magna]